MGTKNKGVSIYNFVQCISRKRIFILPCYNQPIALQRSPGLTLKTFVLLSQDWPCVTLKGHFRFFKWGCICYLLMVNVLATVDGIWLTPREEKQAGAPIRSRTVNVPRSKLVLHTYIKSCLKTKNIISLVEHRAGRHNDFIQYIDMIPDVKWKLTIFIYFVY